MSRCVGHQPSCARPEPTLARPARAAADGARAGAAGAAAQIPDLHFAVSVFRECRKSMLDKWVELDAEHRARVRKE
jgi:hypothetical protein